jgi:hypothetical protein
VAARILAPANRLWFQLSLALGKVVTPVVFGLFFYLVMTPVGLVARLLKWDPMRRTYTQDESYWIHRKPPGPTPESLIHQF